MLKPYRDVAPVHVPLRCIHSPCPTSLMRTTHKHPQTHGHSGTQAVAFRRALHPGFVWNGDADMCVHGSFAFGCMSMCAVCVCVFMSACLSVRGSVNVCELCASRWLGMGNGCTEATRAPKNYFSTKCNASSRAHITYC